MERESYAGDNVTRIAFIGDSITVGIRVPFEQTFVRRFAGLANQQGFAQEVQALNFGVDGYDVLQLLELLRVKVLEFHPDEVVYMMCLNDVDFESASGDKKRYFRKPRSFFLDMVRILPRILSRNDYHVYYFNKNKKELFDAISTMQTVLKQQHIRFMVAILPVFYKDAAGFGGYPLASLHREIGEFLSAEGIV